MLTSLVSLQQGNVKKSEKSMKTINIDGENLVTYDNIKSQKTQSFNLSLKDTVLEKTQGRGVKLTPPPGKPFTSYKTKRFLEVLSLPHSQHGF